MQTVEIAPVSQFEKQESELGVNTEFIPHCRNLVQVFYFYIVAHIILKLVQEKYHI